MGDFEELTRIGKALGDPNRVRALAALFHGELCVCQLIELLRLAPSTVSKHMAVLREAGLVASRRDGRWIYYHLPQSDPDSPADRAMQWFKGSINCNSRAQHDLQLLSDICGQDPEALCRKQSKR